MYWSFPSLLFLVLVIISGLGCMLPAVAAPADQENTVLYKTDFSDASGWITNSNERFYLDNSTGRYHFLIEGATGSYSAVPLPEKVSGPFILEFDVTPVVSEEGSTFRFGIGSDSKDSQKGPLVMAELANKKGGNLFYLKTISKENSMNTVGSSPSTGSSGTTVRYMDNTQYHIRLTYYAADSRASITVQESGKPGTIFSAIAPVSGRMVDLSHLFLTSLGDGVPGPQAEGYIDNITLTLPKNQAAVNPTPEPTVTGTVTPEPTLAGSILEETETPVHEPLPAKPRNLLPPPPTSTPTPKSGGFPLLLLPALAGAALLSIRRQ